MPFVPPPIVAIAYPPPHGEMVPRALAGITDLIVHHTAEPLTGTPLQIDAEHRANGWAMIGYNFVIDPAGTVSAGRPIEVVPAAALGRNPESINVVLIGNFERDDPGFTGAPSTAQLAALEALAAYAYATCPSLVRIVGHCDVTATACPGSELYRRLPEISRRLSRTGSPPPPGS